MDAAYGSNEPNPSRGDALRVGALTRLRGFVCALGDELRRDLDSGSPGSDGWRDRCQTVESRQAQLQQLQQMLDDVRETTPDEMRQILASSASSSIRSNGKHELAVPDALEGVVQELHDAIGRNVRLARREAVLEAYCEEQNKVLSAVESSESRLKHCEAQETRKNEELVQTKLAAEREALELKVSWRKDRMQLHKVQCELQQANQTVASLEEQLSEAVQKQEAQSSLLQSARVTDIQATVWQSKLSTQAKEMERLKSRCAELDSERQLTHGQYQSLEAWAADAKQVESQQSLQKKIFQERCVELQAKLDKSRVACYEKGRELEVLKIHFEEQQQQLQEQISEASRSHDRFDNLKKEKRTLEDKVTDLEVQIAESLLSGSYHASQHGQLRARVEDLSKGVDQKSQVLKELESKASKFQELENHYSVANAARDALARQCKLLEEENGRLEGSLAKELREKDDALNANAALRLQLESLVESQRFEVHRIESEASKASDFALERFEAQQQEQANSSAEELKQAAHDRARLHSEFASAEAQGTELKRLREREKLWEQLKMQYHLANKLLGRFRDVHEVFAWKDLMAEVDATILSLLRQDTTMDADGLGRGSGEGGGRTASRMVLTDMVTQLQSLVESAEKSAQSAVQHRDTMRMELEAAHQEHFAFEVRHEELETQNFHLKAELAKSQRQESLPLALPDDIPEEYSAIIREVVLNGWDSVEWGGNFTLLHWAAMQNRQGLCQSLLELRADPFLKDDAGMMAADYAREKGSKDVLAVLAVDRATALEPFAKLTVEAKPHGTSKARDFAQVLPRLSSLERN